MQNSGYAGFMSDTMFDFYDLHLSRESSFQHGILVLCQESWGYQTFGKDVVLIFAICRKSALEFQANFGWHVIDAQSWPKVNKTFESLPT